MNKLRLGLILVGLGIGGWWGAKTPPAPKILEKRVAEIRIYPSQIPAVPKRLIVSKLEVNAKIEAVVKDNEGRMDIPKEVSNAGWYSLGSRPGERGNAVIDGHINNPQLKPEIFAHLDRMQSGDIVTVVDENNQVWNFRVIKTEVLPELNFPIGEVFGATESANLNLITCDGEWDKKLGTYNKRVVVFTQFLQ